MTSSCISQTIPVDALQAQQKPRPAANKPKVPPMPVQAKTQEEAAAKAKEAYDAQPKASAKTGRSFFQRLKPEKVMHMHLGSANSDRELVCSTVLLQHGTLYRS